MEIVGAVRLPTGCPCCQLVISVMSHM